MRKRRSADFMDKDKNNIKKIVSRLTEFEWEQFELGNLFVRCRTEEDAKEFVYNCNLRDIGLENENETNWGICRENTTYYIIKKEFLSYCHIKYYNEHFSDIPIIEFKYNPTPICAFNNKKDNNKVKKEKYMAANNSTNMDFKQAIRTWDRMCANFADGCSPCPLHKARGNKTCRDWVGKNPDEAIKIFVKWAAENPEKTIMDDFFEKFPNALRTSTGVPKACARHIGYIKECYRTDCAECWQKPLEEVEE